jgi:group I intron endonuclease
VYENVDSQKLQILAENKGKAGVYLFTNLTNGKSYVGSSVKLNRRFNKYYNYNHIADPDRNMSIDKALLKYGYSNFQLEILEYCDPSLIIKREQFYLDLLKPEYNILPKAYSSLGYKHLEKTLEKMRKPKTPEQLVIIKKHLTLLNASPFPAEVRARISAGMANFNVLTKSKKLVFTNVETHETIRFASFRDAALKMKVSRNTISKYIKSQKPYGKYKITLDKD